MSTRGKKRNARQNGEGEDVRRGSVHTVGPLLGELLGGEIGDSSRAGPGAALLAIGMIAVGRWRVLLLLLLGLVLVVIPGGPAPHGVV